MRFAPTIFAKLVEPIGRRRFAAIVARHDGDAYDKSFFSFDHLVTLIFAQLSDLDSLRALQAGWNASSSTMITSPAARFRIRPSATPTSVGRSPSSPMRSKRSPSFSTVNAEATATISSG